jgi:8-oxo-dGTP pyrophosphatase MutT (NUDIX family)
VSSAEKRGAPRVLRRTAEPISRWVRLETISAMMPGASEAEIYHAIGQADYVSVLCLHSNGQFVVVRQYRPVPDRWTTEFPGGLREENEAPEQSAMREVEEETGLSAKEIIRLVDNFADVGRLTNRIFGFFVLAEGSLGSAEPGVEPSFVSASEIAELAADGSIAAPASIGLLYLAGRHPRIREICAGLGLGEPPWMQA